MAKRQNSMPHAISQDETGLAVVPLDPVRMPPATSRARKTPPRMSKIQLSQDHDQGGWDQSGPGSQGQHERGQHERGRQVAPQDRQPQVARNYPSETHPSENQQTRSPDSNVTEDVRSFIRDRRLDEAARLVTALLHQRIAAGDSELGAVGMLLQHYDMILSRQPPLSHIGALPLRPNDRLYTCFDQFIDLIRQQQSQVSELQAIIAELI